MVEAAVPTLALCWHYRSSRDYIGMVGYSQLGAAVELRLEVELACIGFCPVLLLHQSAICRLGMA